MLVVHSVSTQYLKQSYVSQQNRYTWRHVPGATVTSRAFRIGGKAPSNYRRRE